MENNENQEIKESTSVEEQNQQVKYDPAAEAKHKVIFFLVVVAIMIALKYLCNF